MVIFQPDEVQEKIFWCVSMENENNFPDLYFEMHLHEILFKTDNYFYCVNYLLCLYLTWVCHLEKSSLEIRILICIGALTSASEKFQCSSGGKYLLLTGWS